MTETGNLSDGALTELLALPKTQANKLLRALVEGEAMADPEGAKVRELARAFVGAVDSGDAAAARNAQAALGAVLTAGRPTDEQATLAGRLGVVLDRPGLFGRDLQEALRGEWPDAVAIDWTAAAVNRNLPTPIVSTGSVDAGGTLLPAGEVVLVAGAGSSGKSRLALQVAIAAAAGGGAALGGSTVRGLVIAGGPAVVAGYEDAAPYVRSRARNVAEHLGGSALKAVDDAQRLSAAVFDRPLWSVGPDDGPAGPDDGPAGAVTDAGRILFDRAAEVGARLVVIDPVAMAWVGGEGYAVEPVGAFVAWLRRSADELGCGVLAVHHTSKAGRRAVKVGESVDAVDVAGSHAWIDRVRACLMLSPRADRENVVVEGGAVLAVAKSNYSKVGQQWPLESVTPGGAWRLAPDADARGDDDGEGHDDGRFRRGH